MKNLSRKTFNIMISTIITIAINLILMGIVAYKEKKVCIDSNGFETACHITTIDQIINVMFPIILLVMIVLVLRMKIKKMILQVEKHMQKVKKKGIMVKEIQMKAMEVMEHQEM